jgi:thiamine-monophosphate kinase
MNLGDLGEFGVIDRIARAARRKGVPRHVVIGVGDDAAVLRPRRGEDLVTSTDAMVEGAHFRWSSMSPRTLGRRALVANLSDLAAMGARPLGFVCALAAPACTPLARIDGLVAGLLSEAERYSCPLVGGNLAAARETVVTITVLGAVEPGRALRRSGARPGDRLYVTGVLGAAALEVARAEGGGRVRRVAVPRLEAGRALARLPGIGGCIDVSDGLASDLSHLLEHAPLHAKIDVGALPRPGRFDAACRRAGLDPERLLLAGGEDYELLFTARPSLATGRIERALGVRVTSIGAIARGRGKGRLAAGGWRHF